MGAFAGVEVGERPAAMVACWFEFGVRRAVGGGRAAVFGFVGVTNRGHVG